jgi:uncharacterized protein
MNLIFVDTSAILALLVHSDRMHNKAKETFSKLASGRATLVSSSSVLVETYALLGSRFGLSAIANCRDNFAPLLEVVWVNQVIHDLALDLLLERNVRDLSLVDATSFVVMKRRRLKTAFAYDKHFVQEGFDLLD